MCGIVGSTGYKNALEDVLEGLRRLEYRGYDSAGVSFRQQEKIELIKKEGKVSNLEQSLDNIKPISKTVIGHTRWATHGKVNDDNAHPHANELISIVHNGIIENAFDLKKDLELEGNTFSSETDSEVFLVLLTKKIKSGIEIKKAISESFKLIEGNSAIVIMTKEDNKIYAIKRSAPLVCGQAKDSLHVSSDPYALVGFASELFFPEDEIICELNPDIPKISFYDLDLNESNSFSKEHRSNDLEVSKKGTYEHFMLKEIHEQPDLINNLLEVYKGDSEQKSLKNISKLRPETIHIIGCGTAWHAGLVIADLIEREVRVRVNVELASEFRYKNPILNENDIAIFISQSGETADTIACAELCQEKKIPLYSIVNVKGSTLYRMCEENFLIHAEQEIGVASTKAFTQQVLVGFLIALSMKGKDSVKELSSEYELLSKKINVLLDRSSEIQDISKIINSKKGFIYTGRNMYFPIALEGALKLKEIAYVHAEGYASGELKHGPIALIDEEMVNISLIGPELFDKTLSNTEEVRARRGVIVIVGPEKNEKIKSISDYHIDLDFNGIDITRPIYMNVVMQLLSYYIAKEKGTDIDKPRNLAKSVTVE